MCTACHGEVSIICHHIHDYVGSPAWACGSYTCVCGSTACHGEVSCNKIFVCNGLETGYQEIKLLKLVIRHGWTPYCNSKVDSFENVHLVYKCYSNP